MSDSEKKTIKVAVHAEEIGYSDDDSQLRERLLKLLKSAAEQSAEDGNAVEIVIEVTTTRNNLQ